MPSTTYIPGVCNIGIAEIAMRRTVAIGASVITIAGAAILLALNVSPWVRLVLFLPALIAVLNILQVAFKFCVAFGSQGLFNVSGSMGKTESIDQAEFRAADQKKAIKIWVYALILTGLITTLLFVI